jgi:hypothetical protein
MAKSGTERLRKWRNKHKNKRRIDVYISPASGRRLDRLTAHYNEGIGQTIERSLKSLEQLIKDKVKIREKDETLSGNAKNII